MKMLKKDYVCDGNDRWKKGVIHGWLYRTLLILDQIC